MEQLEVIKITKDAKSLIILDQTQLPNHEEYLTLKTKEEMWKAIKLLQVRGAPAMGVFAGYAMAVLAQHYPYDVASLKTKLVEEAKTIDKENLAMNQKIAEYGVTLLKDGDGILTHCNAGYLACLGYGTATAPMYLAHEKGMNIHVYSDETRPLLQGARLTSYELFKAGIDVTSICDNMASIVMKQGKIQCVMVGCDRIAANGDFANKIGTSGVAILAKHYGIPFYTLGPSSTIDFNTKCGDDIHIEERDEEEVGSMWYKEPMILKDIKKYNPSFDVTDHSLLTAIVTEESFIHHLMSI